MHRREGRRVLSLVFKTGEAVSAQIFFHSYPFVGMCTCFLLFVVADVFLFVATTLPSTIFPEGVERCACARVLCCCVCCVHEREIFVLKGHARVVGVGF